MVTRCWSTSTTKLWNCPGLRLGYVIAPDADAADRVRHRQPEWAVNALALAVLPELLARTDLPGWHSQIGELQTKFAASLDALGYRVETTAVNWVLVDHPDLRSLLARQRVVVRDCTSFGLPGLHRVALPHPADFARVLAAFAAAMNA